MLWRSLSFHRKSQQHVAGGDSAVVGVAGVRKEHAAHESWTRVAHGSSVGLHAIYSLEFFGRIVLPDDLAVPCRNRCQPAIKSPREKDAGNSRYSR